MAYQNIVETKELVKSYGEKNVVDGISLEIRRGECFGLLGPNGAGKTTTMKMMYGSAQIGGGEMYVLGLNVREHIREIKSRIGVVPQEDGLDPDFTVLENLLVYARYHDIAPTEAMSRAQELLKWLRLSEYAERAVETLSGGLKRRLTIARSLLNNPELVILDEPTTGLDPQARVWIWGFFRELKKQNASVVLTTHYMEEAEQMCDRLAIMDHGRILAIGTPADLIREHAGREVVEFECKAADVNYYLGRLRAAGLDHQVINDTISVLVREGQDSKAVLDLISGDRITLRRPTLNDVFLKLSGHQLRDEA
ncbi:MAG: ABC transporter ATP-binding protein [Bdellovibrionaceae bacterium]|nr:ABC transporter ATP-binding protein [Pseudobdellovibrionaceae bacterium]MBX3034110.1 ABC transporter ATP-binding protein [Pseudobdellovibrionaceae bacterium]